MPACPACGVELASSPKFCPECGTRLDPATAVEGESRRVVTILFSDVTGSTALGERLDPEAVRTLMGRYFGAMKAVLERHGGTVEKFIGDAIMAVFGIPTLHEDDALRAVRAAAQMREALAGLNSELATERGVTILTRTGITTGEVVAGDPSAGQTLVTGDTVNTAARLEQAAAPGEILIGAPTWRLVRDAVTADAVAAVSAKGKALPVPAYRLGSVAAGTEGHARRLDAPLVGRERELARLTQSYTDAVSERRCELFTLLGAAGVGKSRLVREFLAAVGDEARVVRGRCLPYGEGITYWPLAEALKDAAAIDERDDRAGAQRKLLALLDGERDAELLAGRLATAIGLSDEPAPQSELFWAVRRTLEHLAHQQPLVVVWEDIHWAEPTFLDLIDHLADWSRDAPILLLAPARPELLDARPGWGGGKHNANSILLEALPAEAAGRLIDALPGGSELPEALRSRIAAAAEGNPLFVEELLAMLIDDGVLKLDDGRWRVAGDLEQLAIPPSIQALLAARLGRLSAGERQVAGRASVVGRIFEPEAVAALSSPVSDSDLNAQLLALVRKELVRPDRSDVTGGDAFKFRHILIRDAAYDSLPKRERAELHERFADWLAAVAADRLNEFAAILGYHLELAARYLEELGGVGDSARALRERAAIQLLAAGIRAVEREDDSAAVSLLGRTAELAGESSVTGLEALSYLGLAHAMGGRLAEREATAERMLATAEAIGDEAAVLLARLDIAWCRSVRDPSQPSLVGAMVEKALDRLELLGDHAGLASAWRRLAGVAGFELRFADAAEAIDSSIRESRLAGNRALESFAVAHRLLLELLGPLPVQDAVDHIDRLRPTAGPLMRADLAGAEAALRRLRGDADTAVRHALSAAEAVSGEINQGLALWRSVLGLASLLSGKPQQASLELRQCLDEARRSGDESLVLTIMANLAEALLQQGLLDEARDYIDQAKRADESDIGTRASLKRATARYNLATGDLQTAVRSAREAVELLEPTQSPLEQGESFIVLAEVLAAAGQVEAAGDALAKARAVLDGKGASAAVARVDALRQRLLTR